MVPVRQVRCIWHTHPASPAHRILNTLSDLYKTLMHLCARKSSKRQTAGRIQILLVRISVSTTRAMNLLQLQMRLLCLNFAIRPRGNVDENSWAAVLLALSKRSILFSAAAFGSAASVKLCREGRLCVHLCFCAQPIGLLICLSPSSLLSLPAASVAASLQCRHGNNLSPSDQLIWARRWVAIPSSQSKGETHHGVEVGVGVAWETIRGEWPILKQGKEKGWNEQNKEERTERSV